MTELDKLFRDLGHWNKLLDVDTFNRAFDFYFSGAAKTFAGVLASLVRKRICGPQAQTPNTPEGASRCRVFASGISLYLCGSRSAVRRSNLMDCTLH